MARLYYGWIIAAAGMGIYTLLIGATFNAYGLFVVPVAQDLHLSRADANTGLILMNLGGAIVAPFLGRVLDRVSARVVVMVSAALFGCGLITLAKSQSLWLSAIVLATLVPLAVQGAASLTMPTLIARWFNAQRGRAMAVTILGMSLGGVVITPIVGALIDAQGWRTALLAIGVVGAAAILALALVIRERPGPSDVEPGASATVTSARAIDLAQGAGPMKVGTILKMTSFWTIAGAAAIASGIGQGLLATLAPLARDQGYSMMQAAGLISVMGALGIAAKLLLSIIGDMLNRVLMLTGVFVAGAILNACLLFSQTYVSLLACAAILGFINGFMTPVFYALLADRFGAASFGTVRGLTIPLIAGASIVTLRFAGEVFDRTGGYELAFGVFVGLELLAAALIIAPQLLVLIPPTLLLKARKPPAGKSAPAHME